jgi:ABC-type multidrug transport system ATPase subunit
MDAGDEPVLTVDGLTRLFGGAVGFEDVSLTVARGEACVLTGPNGAGKTTLLRCVVGAERPDAGVVLLDGRRLDETDPRIRAAVACVLDDVDFFPDLSVAEHLELMAYAHGNRDGRADVDQLLDELELAGAAGQLPPTLSSGQRRRLALASCFVRPRRLLVLDEPEQRLDRRGHAWLVERLRAEKADGVAVLMATHDAELIAAVGDRRVELGA